VSITVDEGHALADSLNGKYGVSSPRVIQ